MLYAYPVLSTLSSCKSEPATKTSDVTAEANFRIQPIPPSTEDNLVLAEGLEYNVIASWDDAIGGGLRFGDHCDYLAFLPFEKNNSDEGLLWVNHEYFNPLFVTGPVPNEQKTKEQVMREMECLGGSFT